MDGFSLSNTSKFLFNYYQFGLIVKDIIIKNHCTFPFRLFLTIILWRHSNQYGGKVCIDSIPFLPFEIPFLTFPRTLTCSFSEYKIYPGHGGMYIRKDGQVI